MAQGQVLQGELAMAAEEEGEEANQVEQESDHRFGLCPDQSREINHFAGRGFGEGQAVIAPRSPWQNAYAERVIGSMRRECLDHVVVIGERHLLGILSKYVDYYNGTRTHLSLAKDAREPRSVQPPSQGGVVEVARVGGLHHEYLRRAA